MSASEKGGRTGSASRESVQGAELMLSKLSVQEWAQGSRQGDTAMVSQARIVQDWLEGWNTRNLDQLMRHYAEDAVFISPSVLATESSVDGTLHGKAAIRGRYSLVCERYPKLRFELEEVIERPYGLLVIYYKLGVFAERPGLTVEVFDISAGLIRRNIVYWGVEEVMSQFSVRVRQSA